MSGLWWLAVLSAPLLASLALWWRPTGTMPWLWLTCVPALLASIWPPAELALGPLWPGAAWGIEDDVGQVWLAFTAVLWGCASCFAVKDLADDTRRLRFWAFWLLSLAGNLLLILALDLASFYVGFSVMSLAAYGLIVHLRGPGPRQAGRLYLQLAILGEMLVYAGIMLRIHEAGGTLMLADLQELPISQLTAALLIVGFGLKAGFWPLHVWLPLAHPAAPAAASAVLSGAMIKAGLLGIWRFLPVDGPVIQSWAVPILTIGFISMFYGVVIGLLQTKAKSVLAFSSISQMGYLLVILGLAWQHPDNRLLLAGVLAMYAAHHALAKGALFMGAGLSSHYRLSPWYWAAMLIPAVALSGMPFTSGAAVKTALKKAMEEGNHALFISLLTIGSLGTALLVFRAVWLMRVQNAHLVNTAVDPSQAVPWTALCIAPLTLPWIWPELRDVLVYSLDLHSSWSLFWPVVLALGIALLAVRLGIDSRPVSRFLPEPARWLSLRLKKLLRPRQARKRAPRGTSWRKHERHLNRLFTASSVSSSAWIIGALLLVGWMMAI